MSSYVELNAVENPEPGGTPPAEWFQGVNANYDGLWNAKFLRFVKISTQSISSGSATTVTFTAGTTNDSGMGVTANQITATEPGVYLLTATAEFAANATGYRDIRLRLNSVTYLAYQRAVPNSASQSTILTIATLYKLAAGDTVGLIVEQNSGSSLNISSGDVTALAATWVSIG